jgi:hypothetical protein
MNADVGSISLLRILVWSVHLRRHSTAQSNKTLGGFGESAEQADEALGAVFSLPQSIAPRAERGLPGAYSEDGAFINKVRPRGATFRLFFYLDLHDCASGVNTIRLLLSYATI